jgi:hypothetical protein
MATETDADAAATRSSRRRLLTGLAAGAGIVAAETLVQGKPALAGSDGDVVLGVDNQLTAGTTGVSSSAVTGLHGRCTNAGNPANTGVFGEGPTGVHGTGSSIGVQGNGNTGVAGIGSGYGVYAHSTGGSPGLYALSDGGDGAVGLGSRHGVYGTGSSNGVRGDGVGAGANGVYGDTNNAGGSGVYGQNDGAGFGVAGRAVNGTGVLADSANGTALQVTGRTKFSTSGTAVIASGQKKVIVTLAGVTTSDFVLATVQGSGAFYVKNASAGTGQFTININKAPTSPATVKVAYFVISAS